MDKLKSRWISKIGDEYDIIDVDPATKMLSILHNGCKTITRLSVKSANRFLNNNKCLCKHCRQNETLVVDQLSWNQYKSLFREMRTGNRTGQLSIYKLRKDGHEKGIMNITDFLPSDSDLSRRCYHIENDLREIPICSICEQRKAKWYRYNNKHGYHSCKDKMCIRELGSNQYETIIENKKSEWEDLFDKLDDYELIEYGGVNDIRYKHKECGKISNWYAICIKDRIKSKKTLCTHCNPVGYDSSSEMAKREVFDIISGLDDYEIVNYIDTKNISIEHTLCGNTFTTNKSLIQYRIDNGMSICINCEPLHSRSSAELAIYSWLSSIYDGEIIENDKSVLSGKELDIYIPDKKVAIEFNGTYWHSTKVKEDARNRHQYKSIQCKEKSIRLIHVWESDWIHKQGIIKSIIKNAVVGANRVIYGRKCEIKEVDTDISYEFMEDNHIQGGVYNRVRIGLYYNNELVSMMTFNPIDKRDNKWEIGRLATKLDTIVIGGANKMYRYFLKSYKPSYVLTFAFFDYFTGKVYENMGFDIVGLNKPGYFYVDRNQLKYNRRSFTRKRMIKKGLLRGKNDPRSEAKAMDDAGYYRIFDAGVIKYEKYYDGQN